jgi:iron complex transport system substrate-binding protein
VKNSEIYGVLPYNYYSTNYGTVLANSYYIGSILFPEKFADIDPEVKADEIYETFVGKSVYQDMKNTYGGFIKINL